MEKTIQIQLTERLLFGLESAGIKFAVWKGSNHLTKSLNGTSDIDLLVHPDDCLKFEDVLLKLSFKKLITQPWSRSPEVEDWLGMDSQRGTLHHIHTHYRMITGLKYAEELVIPWSNELFKYARKDPETGWPIPGPEMEMLILLVRVRAKMPLSKRLKAAPDVPARMLAELSLLLDKTDPEKLRSMAEELLIKLPDDMEESIALFKENKNVNGILKVAREINRQLSPYSRMSLEVAFAKSTYHNLIYKLKRKFNRYFGPFRFGKSIQNKGVVIAFIGSDGSGKSTVSQELTNWLSYKIDTHYFYLGDKPFIRSHQKKVLYPGSFLHAENNLSRYLRRILRQFYFPLRARTKLGLLKLAQKLKKQGSLIVCDRHPQMYTSANDGPNFDPDDLGKSATMERATFHQIAKVDPDLVFRLVVSPEVAITRKPDHNKESIKKKCQSIREIKFKSAKVIDIDADKPYAEVLLSIKNKIWNNIP